MTNSLEFMHSSMSEEIIKGKSQKIFHGTFLTKVEEARNVPRILIFCYIIYFDVPELFHINILSFLKVNYLSISAMY